MCCHKTLGTAVLSFWNSEMKRYNAVIERERENAAVYSFSRCCQYYPPHLVWCGDCITPHGIYQANGSNVSVTIFLWVQSRLGLLRPTPLCLGFLWFSVWLCNAFNHELWIDIDCWDFGHTWHTGKGSVQMWQSSHLEGWDLINGFKGAMLSGF